MGYVIRLPANRILQEKIRHLLKRPVGRPPHEVRRYYASLSYQAQSWKKPRRVGAKVEWHPGEVYPRVGFIVTNLARPSASWPSTTSVVRRSSASRKARARSSGRACHAVPSLPTPSAFAPRAGLQPRQFHADAGDAEDRGAVVADQPAREADQDRRQGSSATVATSRSKWPRSQCRDRCSRKS